MDRRVSDRIDELVERFDDRLIWDPWSLAFDDEPRARPATGRLSPARRLALAERIEPES